MNKIVLIVFLLDYMQCAKLNHLEYLPPSGRVPVNTKSYDAGLLAPQPDDLLTKDQESALSEQQKQHIERSETPSNTFNYNGRLDQTRRPAFGSSNSFTTANNPKLLFSTGYQNGFQLNTTSNNDNVPAVLPLDTSGNDTFESELKPVESNLGNVLPFSMQFNNKNLATADENGSVHFKDDRKFSGQNRPDEDDKSSLPNQEDGQPSSFPLTLQTKIAYQKDSKEEEDSKLSNNYQYNIVEPSSGYQYRTTINPEKKNLFSTNFKSDATNGFFDNQNSHQLKNRFSENKNKFHGNNNGPNRNGKFNDKTVLNRFNSQKPEDNSFVEEKHEVPKCNKKASSSFACGPIPQEFSTEHQQPFNSAPYQYRQPLKPFHDSVRNGGYQAADAFNQNGKFQGHNNNGSQFLQRLDNSGGYVY